MLDSVDIFGIKDFRKRGRWPDQMIIASVQAPVTFLFINCISFSFLDSQMPKRVMCYTCSKNALGSSWPIFSKVFSDLESSLVSTNALRSAIFIRFLTFSLARLVWLESASFEAYGDSGKVAKSYGEIYKIVSIDFY